jgi:hypothetical protein
MAVAMIVVAGPGLDAARGWLVRKWDLVAGAVASTVTRTDSPNR